MCLAFEARPLTGASSKQKRLSKMVPGGGGDDRIIGLRILLQLQDPLFHMNAHRYDRNRDMEYIISYHILKMTEAHGDLTDAASTRHLAF